MTYFSRFLAFIALTFICAISFAEGVGANPNEASEFICNKWLIEPVAHNIASVESDDALDAKILKIIAPSFQLAERLIAQMPDARSIAELKQQIQTVMSNREIEALYMAENLELDALAPKMNILGPFGIPNFEAVVPHVYRSANPTLEQAELLIGSKTVDSIFSLNYELDLLTRIDRSQPGPVTEGRRLTMLDELMRSGFNRDRAQSEVRFYEQHLSFAQAATNRTMPYHTQFLLNHPKDELKGFFVALQRVLEIQASGKSVLFHCSIGKHRTGLLAMLVKAAKKDGLLTRPELNQLYVEFIRHNWNDKPVTRLQYLFFFPLILKSEPFRVLADTY